MDAVIQRQIDMDREIDRLCAAKFAATCAACGGKCCRANHAAMTIRGYWLRTVSERAHGRWWPDDWRDRAGCAALGPAGCVLTAGRPPCCWQWLCEPLLAECGSFWELVFYVFVSELPGELARLSPELNLHDLDQSGVEANLPLIAERIEWAHALLAEAKTLIDPATGEAERSRTALRLLCLMPQLLHPLAREAMLERL